MRFAQLFGVNKSKGVAGSTITDFDNPHVRAALAKRIFELKKAISKAKDQDSPLLKDAETTLQKAEKAAMAEPGTVRKLVGTDIKSLLPIVEETVSTLTGHSN